MGLITVWSDVGCPWASLALHTLHEGARERGVDLRIDHRAFPLELLNGEPTPKPTHDAEVAAITSVVPTVGWSEWAAPDSTYPVTTLPAMEAVQAAKAQGLAAADELDAALRRACFVEHRCISIHPVIEEVARSCPGVDADALMGALRHGAGRERVYADLDEARSGEVQGSPHLWTEAGPFAVNPGVDDAQHLRRYDASWVEELHARA